MTRANRRGPEPGTARQAYDAWHTRYSVDAASEAPWHRLVKRHLDEARDLAGRRVLEMACGRGGFACWLASRSPTPALLVAADFARTAVVAAQQFARDQGIPGVRWELADIQAIGHADATFDTVICCETLEHVPQPEQALAEVARVLRPGGRLYLSTPNYLGPMGLYRVYARLRGRRYTEEGQPINHPLWLPRTIALVRRAGLAPLAVDAVGHYLPLPGRPPVELPALDRLRALTRWFALHSLIVAAKPAAPA